MLATPVGEGKQARKHRKLLFSKIDSSITIEVIIFKNEINYYLTRELKAL